MNLIWIPVGLAVALWLPRQPFRVILVAVGLLSVLILTQALPGDRLPLPLFSLAVALGMLLVVLLARQWRRPFVPFLLIPGAMLATLTLPNGPFSERQGLPMAVFGLVCAVTGVVWVHWGVRIACATWGAALVLAGQAWATKWVWFGTVAVLLIASSFTSRKAAEVEPPKLRPVLRLAGACAGALFLVGLALPWLAPELPAPADPGYAARLAKLREKAPSGGLLWPQLSEAVTWQAEEQEQFPAFENLDALYLSGRPAGLVKLPGTSPFRGGFGLHAAVVELRMKKDAAELAALRAAAQATVSALKDALPLYRSGASEHEIALAIAARQKGYGAEGDSFPLIVASGPRAAKVHAFELDGKLETGQLVVTDIGAYKDHYASDFTRTLPVGGKFDARTRKLYEAVYASQQAALKACRPGVRFSGRAKEGEKTLDQVSRDALKAAGVEPDYPHGLGHPVGLFVHDVTNGRALEPGMVITLEPGLYRPGDLGIRIEDTYLVTEKGCELLTTGFPADPDSVEALMAQAQQPSAQQGVR